MFSYDDIIRYYTYFYKKRFNSFNYKFKPTEKSEKTIQTFIKLIEKKYGMKLVGKNFLWDYFIYGFNYWRDAKLQAFHGQFRIELILGKKAFERFNDKEKDDHWVIEKSEIIKLYDFKKSDLVVAQIVPYKGDYEVNIKKLYYGTPEGLYQCISNTTMYNHKHLLCIKCPFKDDCKKILKEKLPNIYKQRGYDN